MTICPQPRVFLRIFSWLALPAFVVLVATAGAALPALRAARGGQ